MPKEARTSMSYSTASTTAPYPQHIATSASQRNAAIWSTSDDEILLRARASGLNWQPIASRNFPNKTANACRKRHERLIERRHVDDWDHQKLEHLAQEYLACRKEMWEILAARLGERWNVVEAKCMEKGLKTLQTTARTAQRKASADHQAHQQQTFCIGTGGGGEEDRGISDHNSDSGIVLSSGSEPDMEATDERRDSVSGSITRHHGASASWSESYGRRQQRLHQEHLRSRSLPLPLPQYQPPAQAVRSADSAAATRRMHGGSNLGAISYDRPNYTLQRYSPETQQRLSIQSVLSPLEPHDHDSRHGEAANDERDGQDRPFR